MEAAAHGRSTIGIPREAARKFLADDELLANSAIPAGLTSRPKLADDVEPRGHAAGIVFVSPDGEILLLRRSPAETNFGGHWGLPGGGAEDGETPEMAAVREAKEEIGADVDPAAMKPLEKKATPTGMAFHTFAVPVAEPFVPTLDNEHTGYAWASPDMLPRPLHPAVEAMLADRLGVTGDMTPEDWRGLRDGFVRWTLEEEAEPEHIFDAAFNESDHPRAPDGKFGSGGSGEKSSPHEGHKGYSYEKHSSASLPEKGFKPRKKATGNDATQMAQLAWGVAIESDKPQTLVPSSGRNSYVLLKPGQTLDFGMPHIVVDPDGTVTQYRPGKIAGDSALTLALDRDSVREYDRDGRLRVAKTNISKANVCPYRGEEIPGWQQLGLDPRKVYNLLRDPDELRKGSATLNGVPLLKKHVPVNADDHQPDEVVGSLGTDADFDGTYLTNSLFVNAREAIDGINSGKRRELSAGYHYTPDMTPGNFNGNAYDGVMRDIVFNHVALVEDGRAGPDVVVGDEALREIDMKSTKFAVAVMRAAGASIAPLLAFDQRITLPSSFTGLTPKNFKDRKVAVLSDVRTAIDGKLRKGIALDASMNDLARAIDAFGGIEEAADAEADEVKEAAEVEAVKPEAPPANPENKTGAFDIEPLRNFLRSKGMGEDDIAAVESHLPTWQNPATDSDEDKDKDKDMKDFVSKPAMDAAIAAAVTEARKGEQAIRVALSEVQPWVGEIPTSMAFDSAAAVHRHALKMRNVEGADAMHADALMPVLRSLPRIGVKAAPSTPSAIAMDSVEKARKFAPGLEHISTTL